MKGVRPVIAEIRCKCGKQTLVTRKGIKITGSLEKLTNLGHVSVAKRKQAWGIKHDTQKNSR